MTPPVLQRGAEIDGQDTGLIRGLVHHTDGKGPSDAVVLLSEADLRAPKLIDSSFHNDYIKSDAHPDRPGSLGYGNRRSERERTVRDRLRRCRGRTRLGIALRARSFKERERHRFAGRTRRWDGRECEYQRQGSRRVRNAKAPCIGLYLDWRKLSAIRIYQYALLQEAGNIAWQNPVVFNDYRYSFTTVQPSGIPLSPLTSHLASLLLTNVPVEATPESQFSVVSSEGPSVNKALT